MLLDILSIILSLLALGFSITAIVKVSTIKLKNVSDTQVTSISGDNNPVVNIKDSPNTQTATISGSNNYIKQTK